MCKRVLKNVSSVLCGYQVGLALAHHPEDLFGQTCFLARRVS